MTPAGVVPACRVRDWGLREALEALGTALADSSARELAGGGDAGYYLRQVALQDAVAERMRIGATIDIHRAPGVGSRSRSWMGRAGRRPCSRVGGTAAVGGLGCA